MDFLNMKRKRLQALCKKHGIPANKTNLEMATLLSSILKVSESGNAVSTKDEEEEEEEESVDLNSDNNEKKNKKVRFSPDVETREYEPSVYKGRGGRVSRKRNVVDLIERKVVVKSGIVDKLEVESKEVENRRGSGKREAVDEKLGAKKRRVSAVYKGGIRGRNVAGTEEESEFGGEIDRSDELVKEGGEGLMGRNVSRRKSVVPRKNDEKKADKSAVINFLESDEKNEKVSLKIETLQGMKRKELQSLCKKHGIPANKTNLEMSRLLAAILKVSQETGSSQRFASVIDVSETHGEIARMEQLHEQEPSADDQGDCIEVLRPWCNEEGVDNIGELIKRENVILRGESVLATEAAFSESISLVEQPIQETKLMTPEVTESIKKNKEYKSRSNKKIRDLGDGLDGHSDAKRNFDNAQNVEENQNLTPVVDELPRSQTELISFSSGNQPGLRGSEKGMEVEEMSSGEDSQLENRDFNNHSSENDLSVQVESEFGGEIEGRSDELGKERGQGLVGRNVSRRNSVVPRKDDEKKAEKSVEGNILESEEKSEIVSLDFETLQGMKKKEMQSPCKKHGIPANKANCEMARLLAAILKVSQETGSLQRSGSAIEAFETDGEIERMEQLKEEEPSIDNEGGCLEEPGPCSNEEAVGIVGELIKLENVILKEESILAAEAALTESISVDKKPNQDTKLVTPEVSKSFKTKGYISRSNRKIRDLGDGLDGLSDAKESFDDAQCVKEHQNLTAEVDELPRSQTTLFSCLFADQPGLTGLEKGMEVDEMSRGKYSQHENHDFNDQSTENDCSIQVKSNAHLLLDDIEAQVDYVPSANLEVGQNESYGLDTEDISCTVQETKDNERDVVGLILLTNNNDLEQVELSNEKEGNNASASGAYEEAIHSQHFGDCSTEIREEFKDILDGGNHNFGGTISDLDIPKDTSKELMNQKEKTVLESDCSVDAALVMDVISSKDMDVDTHFEKHTMQDEDFVGATQVEIVGGNSYTEVSPRTHSRGEPSFNQTSCDGFEVSRMEIVDSAVTFNAEFPTKTLNIEDVAVQDTNDSGIKEVAPYLNENSDERMSPIIHDESRFSEEWSVEQLEEKETESGNSQVSDFTQSIHDNLVEGEPAEKHGHCEDISEINGEAIDNGTHVESPKTVSMQQVPNGSSSSPYMLGLLFPDEREEFTETQSAASETLFESLSEDSTDPIATSETVNDPLEINLEKSGQLDNFMKNSAEMNEDMFVDSENVISGNIKPVDAIEMVEKMDELAEELTTQALTSNEKQAEQSFAVEIPVCCKSCRKSEKKSIDTFSELKDLSCCELENETSDVAASALVEGNEEYNDKEEPTTDALQESRRIKDYMPVMPITENVANLEKLETILVEKKTGDASLTVRNESIHASDEISKGLSNVAAIKKEHTELVGDKNKNVEIEHSFAVGGKSMEASVGAIVADKLNFYPSVDTVDAEGGIDASDHKHDNQLSEIEDVVHEGFSWSDITFSTPSELTSEDKNKGCVMGTNEAHKPNVEETAAFQKKEIMNVEDFHLISLSKCETIEDSFAVSTVNASHYDRGQEVEKPATEAQHLNLMNKDDMEIQENPKMSTETAGELEDLHGQNLGEEEVAELNMSNSHDVSELLHIEENERSSMQDDLPLKVDEIQSSCSPEIQDEIVKAETKKDDFSGGVNEQILSEDVQPSSSVLDQSASCVNAAAGQVITSELEDQHGQNVHLEEDGVVEANMCSNHDVSESLHIDEIEQFDLLLKGVQIQGSCCPEIDKDKNVKVESYPVNGEKNDIAGVADVSTLWSEHARELPAFAGNQSRLNATGGQGRGEENKAESELKLASAETRSSIAKQEKEEASVLVPSALKRRSVLIHGTPKRVFESSEMKENILSTKAAAGNLTLHTALPKRRPLQDLTKI